MWRVSVYFEGSHRLEHWEVCAACWLIAGYISDDTFTDFKAGIIALGRPAFERTSLHAESVQNASLRAYTQAQRWRCR
jgi:hypothetical protein